jgi:hypothetical protein
MVNIGLIMVSLILALIMPFRLFLIAYAILGPLHYLTEVNWLHEKDYFLATKKWLVVGAISVTLIVLPKVASFLNLIDHEVLFGKAMLLIDSFSNGVIFLTLWTSACLILLEDHLKRVVGILAGVVIAYLFDELPVYVFKPKWTVDSQS